MLLFLAMIDAQAFSAFGAVDYAGQQSARIRAQRPASIMRVFSAAGPYQLDGFIEIIVVDNTQRLNRLGKRIAEVHLSAIYGITDHSAHGGSAP